MSLVAHLTELRNRIAKALLALAVGTVVGFLWYDHGLLTFLTEPYCALPGELRLQGDEDSLAATQSRQNSLPSMSCITMHESWPS